MGGANREGLYDSGLDGFLEFNGNELLTGAGKISAEQAKLHARTEFERYMLELSEAASDPTLSGHMPECHQQFNHRYLRKALPGGRVGFVTWIRVMDEIILNGNLVW